MTAILRAIEAARELGSRHAFNSLRESELSPGPKASAEEIRELARVASASFGHPVGTCKMGVDKLAVVDPELRVHGILGLRVADASVIPQIITGPGTNASTHMIAGRAAQLVLGGNVGPEDRFEALNTIGAFLTERLGGTL